VQNILTQQAYEQIIQNGYFQPGIILSQHILDQLQQVFLNTPKKNTNVGYHWVSSIDTYTSSNTAKEFFTKFINRKFPAINGRKHMTHNAYNKWVHGSSQALPIFWQACIQQGIVSAAIQKSLLISHDIIAENNINDSMFPMHYDGFSWSLFYQSGDDLTFYVPLQDLNEQSGGRILVERNVDQSENYHSRNSDIAEFSRRCHDAVKPNESGWLMRKSAELSRSVDQVAEAHRQLIMARSARQIPSVQDMSIINAKAGEVFIFNNKNYHAIEPWKLSSKRLNYIVRTLPLYDFALQPPQHFLGTAKCNRYIFNQAKNCLEPFDVNARALYYDWD
tara:strand:+ start:293 stop:1294 length:1002 start_codon:yes stop_codon:yes gene_type:complete